MKIGDIEYTRSVHKGVIGTLDESERVELSFALGIQIRPLLTRVQVTALSGSAVSQTAIVSMENGSAMGAGLSTAALFREERAFPLWARRTTLVTSGINARTGPWETMWWKILLPDVTLHFAETTVVHEWHVVLHYRFAELTSDEIVEIAAQRAQS